MAFSCQISLSPLWSVTVSWSLFWVTLTVLGSSGQYPMEGPLVFFSPLISLGLQVLGEKPQRLISLLITRGSSYPCDITCDF